jgi:branched-chain amino acid transport system substrate-binding protein
MIARRFSLALVAALLLGAGCGVRVPKEEAAAPAATVPGAYAAPEAPTGSVPAASTEAAPADAAGGSAASAATPAAATAGATPAAASGQRTAQGASTAGGAAPAASAGGGSAKQTPRAGASAPGTPGPGPGAPATPGAPAGATSGPCTRELSPIVIGSVSTMSGVLGESLAGEPKTVQAWVAATNAAGGLRCHKLKYIIGDDGGDPNRHASLVQEQVERDKVIAFVYQAAPLSGFASLNYINQKAVPVIGNEGGSPWFYESKYFFPNGASGFDGFSSWFAVPTQSYNAAKKKYAVISCIEAQACSGIDAKAEELAKRFKVDLVYKGKASLTQPDYTSHCLRAQQAGAEVIIPVLDGNSVHRFAKSCDSVGFKPLYTGITSATREDFAKNPLLEGYVGGYFELPWFRTDNPLIAEHLQVIKKYAPDVKPGPQSASGWSVAKLFEIAAQNVSEPPTSASILQGLYSMKNNPVGGLLAPVTYTESVPTTPLRDCFWAAQVKGGKWTGADKPICPPK